MNDRDPEKHEIEAPPSFGERFSDFLGKRRASGSLAQAALLMIGIFFVLYVARPVFLPFAFALMFYFLLRPAVRLLSRALVPNTVGSALVLLGLFGVLTFGVLELSTPATEWATRLPRILRSLEQRSAVLRAPLKRASDMAERFERATSVTADDRAVQVASDKPRLLDEVMSAGTELVASGLVALFALYFLLADGDRLLERLMRLLPDVRERTRAQAMMNEIERRMSRYLRTVTLINLGLGVALATTLYLLGMPNPWLWGALAAVLNFVPYLGPGVGIAVVGLAGLATHTALSDALVPPLAYLALATVEGNILTPFILGRAFHVAPLVVFAWLVAWGWLWGVAGLVVAVPLLMLVAITCEQSPGLAWIAALIR